MAEQTTESIKTPGFRQAFAQTNDSKAFHNKVRGNNKNASSKFKKKSLDAFKKHYDGVVKSKLLLSMENIAFLSKNVRKISKKLSKR